MSGGEAVERSIRPAVPLRLGRTGEVLALLRERGQLTISDVAAEMGVARSTVAERIERLAGEGLVAPVPARVSGRGRPAIAYRFSPDAGRIVTAHVGMTGIRIGIADLAGAVIGHELINLDIARGAASAAETITAGARRLLGDRHSPIYGVGIGVPGPVELRALDRAGSRWTRGEIGERLSAAFATPTYVDQDVNLLALGEQSMRPSIAGPLLCVKVGSVIGCGIVVDGMLVGGADGLAGEIGHTRVAGSDELCACGNRGCLSATAGGAALAGRLAAAGYPTAHARDVVSLAADGEPAAIAALRTAGRQLGTVLAGTVNLLNPHTIALWGYLAAAEEVLLAGVRDSLYQEANPAATFNLQLVTSELGDVTGLRGAALMVAHRELAPDAIDRRIARGS